MNQLCRPKFDESLFSGYLDGELTQGDSQRVRLHLEDCSSCRDLVGDLQRIREAAMTTEFPVPSDEEWREAPPRLAGAFVTQGLGPGDRVDPRCRVAGDSGIHRRFGGLVRENSVRCPSGGRPLAVPIRFARPIEGDQDRPLREC